MATTTDTAVDRVRRYRDEYASHPWTPHDSLEAYKVGVGVCTENALDALLSGDAGHESQMWATLATNISYRYRKAF